VARTFPNIKLARAWAAVVEADLLRGTFIPADRGRSSCVTATAITARDAIRRYVDTVTPTKRGHDVEAARLLAMSRRPMFDLGFDAITSRMISEYRDARLREGAAGATVTRELSLLSHLYKVASVEWGMSVGNPVQGVALPRSAAHRDRVLTDGERSRLLAAVRECRNPWVSRVVIFALETAARRGEILGLEWPSVDLARKTAKVSGKTGARMVPLSQGAIDLLTRLPHSIDRRVFPISREALREAYARAVTRAGIADFTFHDLRHDALTRMARMGLSVLELRAISGHATANMLQRYVQIAAEDLALKLDRRAAA
jgi:integrase